MNRDEKPDAEEIRAFLRNLKAEPWLDKQQRHWPGFLFHVTNIDNAVSILTRGELLSRAEAMRHGVMIHENANPDIIAHTHSNTRESVRLYFRPRTPTAYRNEGIRPIAHQGPEHVPVPVAFVFRAGDVLTRRNVSFSDGSLARSSPGRRASQGSDIAFLRSIPFRDVYHYGSIEDGRNDEITFRRHAEVIVPDRLALDSSFAAVRTRSFAELETLRYLLGKDNRLALDRYGDRIANNNADARLFHGQWTYLQRVTYDSGRILFEFNHNATAGATFTLEVTFRFILDKEPFMRWMDPAFPAKAPLSITLPAWEQSDSDLHVCLKLDGCLAYENVLRHPASGLIPARSTPRL